ncbi:MAG: helix-hairpin-helix domain-containing protein [Methanolobus sp.]
MESWVSKCKGTKNKDPEKLLPAIVDFQGMHVDRCMLYVFREAVYFASNEEHDTELLKWWKWKD